MTTPRDPFAIWDEVRSALERTIDNPVILEGYFASIAPRFEGERLFVLEVESTWHAEKIGERFGTELLALLREATGLRSLTLKIVGRPEGPAEAAGELPFPVAPSSGSPDAVPNEGEASAAGAHRARAKGPDAHQTVLNPKFSFESFVVGKSNEFAHATAVAVAKAPGLRYSPLFIYGGVGLGKTHLMQAIGHQVQKANPKSRVIYTSAEGFLNELLAHMSRDKGPGSRTLSVDTHAAFRKKYRNLDLLLVDDVQFLAGKERTQEEFFHTFNALVEGHKQIVLTSDRPPADLKNLEARLVSRFEGGMVADIQAPDLETRMAIVKRGAEERRLAITEGAVLAIAELVTENIRKLESALLRAGAHAELVNSPITEDVVRTALHELARTRPRKVSIEAVIAAVAKHYGLRPPEMRSKKRNQSIAYPRQIAMFLARELTDESYPRIGEEFGGRDHSTVIHGCDKIARLLGVDTRLRAELDAIKDSIARGEGPTPRHA